MAALPDPKNKLDYHGDHRFELLVDAITDYAVYLLDEDGYVASWNRGAQRFKGYTPQEIIGQHLASFTRRRTLRPACLRAR